MHRKKLSDRIATAYTHFRGSPLFIAVLALLIIVWLAVHWLFGADSDFGALNLVLSTEAGVSTALLVMDMARGEAAQKRAEERHAQQLKYMQHLLEAILEDTSAIEEDRAG